MKEASWDGYYEKIDSADAIKPDSYPRACSWILRPLAQRSKSFLRCMLACWSQKVEVTQEMMRAPH